MTLFVAFRYFRARKTTNAINIIVWISMLAIGVVTAALVVVLSVFNGFENLVKNLYGDFYADVAITASGSKWLTISKEKLTQIAALTAVKAVEPIIAERGILVDQEAKAIVWLKGVSPTYKNNSGITKHLLRGVFEVGNRIQPALVVGVGVENGLQVIAGQTPFPVTVYLPNRLAGASADIQSVLLSANAVPTGAFMVQQEFDDQYAYTSQSFMQYMLDLPQQTFSSVEVYLKDGVVSSAALHQISMILGSGVVVKDRFQQNQGLYAAMQTEKLIIYAIAFLIMVIAGFNIISSLTMMVIDKQNDLAVLKALGMTNQQMGQIFLKLGLLLSGIGALLGMLLGLLICGLQHFFHLVRLGGNSFIINYYPVAVRPLDLAFIAGIIVLISVLSAWLPARRAAAASYSLR